MMIDIYGLMIKLAASPMIMIVLFDFLLWWPSRESTDLVGAPY